MEEFKVSGKWNILGQIKNINGELLINEREGLIRLNLYYDNELKDSITNKKMPKIIPLINGTLFHGAYISLIDCEVVYRHNYNNRHNTVIIDANYAVSGAKFNNLEEAKFDKIIYTLSNITSWANLCNFTYKAEENKDLIIWNKEDSISFQINDQVNVLFYPYNEKDNYKNSINMKEKIGVKISYKEPKSISDSKEDIQSIIDLIMLSTNADVTIEKVQCCNHITSYKVKDKIVENLTKVYISQPLKDKKELWPWTFLFKLQDLIENNKEYLSNWYSKYDKLKPILNLYTSTFKYPNMPIEIHFLNSVQALETYHSRFKCGKKVKKYIKRINTILSKCPEGVKEEHLKHLVSDVQKENDYIILKSRLSDLLLAEFEFVFYKFGRRFWPYEFVDKVVNTRHYYTHYSESKESKAMKGVDLLVASKILRTVLEYYLLKEIGFEQEYIKEKIRYKQDQIEIYYDEVKRSKAIFEDVNN